MRRYKLIATTLLFAMLLAVAGCGSSAPVRGVTQDTIKIGAILDFTGPYKMAGETMRDGFVTWAKHVNDQGGLNGRKVEVLIEDGEANPNKTAAAANKLIFNDKVFAIAGVMGSAAFESVYDLVQKEKVPTLGLGYPESSYSPVKKYIFIAAVPYTHQAARGVDYLVEKQGKNLKLGFLYQDDELGASTLKGVEAALKGHGLTLAAKEAYPRGATDISSQVANLKKAGVNAIFNAAVVTQAVLVKKELAKLNWQVPVMAPNVSALDAYFLLTKDLGAAADGFLVVDYYVKSGDKAFTEATARATKYGGKMDSFGLYTLSNIVVLTEAIKRAGKDVNPDKVVAELEKMKNFDPAGIMPAVSFSDKLHYSGTQSRVFETRGGKWVEVAPPAAPKAYKE